MKQFCYIPILLLLIFSCTGMHQQQHIVTSLDSIYNYPQVKEYLTSHKGEEPEAENLFKKAVDAYRNKKQYDAAASGFVASIKKAPTARAYYELGNVSMDLQNYRQALNAYNIAERLNYSPTAKLFFNTACAWARLDSTKKALNYLEYAIEAGYSNGEQIMKDKDVVNVRKDYEFQQVYLQAMSGASDPATVLWHTFKRSFNQAQFPFVLDRDTKVDIEEDNKISYDYEKFVAEMRDEKFSREVGKDFLYVAAIAENTNYTALVYAYQDVLYDDEKISQSPVGFVLISFDKSGKLIDKKTVGGQKLLNEPFKLCTIQANLSFEVKEFDIHYEKNPEEVGYKDNKIVSSELKTTRYYKIQGDGHFVEQAQALTMR